MVRDPRVVRGSTSRRKPAKPPTPPQDATRLIRPYIPPTKASLFDVKPEVSKHIPVDVSSFLVEDENIVEVVEVDTQTNEFEDRPPTPDYVPKKTGVDVATQIYPEENLFDFDFEIGPILDVVASKTMEQALLEVAEEEELISIRRRQDELDENKELERERIRQLEMVKREEWRKKQRRVKEEQDRVAKETAVYRKVGSVQLMKSLISGLRHKVYFGMQETGFFQNPTKVEVQQVFMPWLLDQTASKAQAIQSVRAAQDTAIQRAVQIAIEKQEHRRCYLRVKARAEVVVKLKINDIGPVVVEPQDTIGTIRQRLQDWVRARGLEEGGGDLTHLQVAYDGEILADDVGLLAIPNFDASLVEVISEQLQKEQEAESGEGDDD